MKIVLASQRVDLDAARQERNDVLDQAWGELLADMGFTLLPVPNRGCDAAVLAERVGAAALVLTGGNAAPGAPDEALSAPERDATESRLAQWAFHRQVPVLAVCRGFQFLNAMLGGRLAPVNGHVRTRHGVRWRDDAPSALREWRIVNSFHTVGIPADALADAFVPMACAEDGSVEAARHVSLPVWGLMWHPERSPAPEASILEAIKRHLDGAEL